MINKIITLCFTYKFKEERKKFGNLAQLWQKCDFHFCLYLYEACIESGIYFLHLIYLPSILEKLYIPNGAMVKGTKLLNQLLGNNTE